MLAQPQTVKNQLPYLKIFRPEAQARSCFSRLFLSGFGKGIDQSNANHNQAEASDGLPLQALAKKQIAKERDQKYPKARPAGIDYGNRDIAQCKGQKIERQHIRHHQHHAGQQFGKVLRRRQKHGADHFEYDG